MNEVAGVISEIVADDANIIFGTSVDETYEDEISVTVVATSFDTPEEEQGQRPIQISPQPPMPPGGGYDPYAPPAPGTRKPRFWGRF